jgi:4-hydroxybutyrate dehydrogenase/sulfolactaldehyde 3-reductase
MVDAPVGRSPQHAPDGKLLIMVGATPNAIERVRPILERMGDTIIHCGPPGMGSRMKIVNNFMSVTLNEKTDSVARTGLRCTPTCATAKRAREIAPSG